MKPKFSILCLAIMASVSIIGCGGSDSGSDNSNYTELKPAYTDSQSGDEPVTENGLTVRVKDAYNQNIEYGVACIDTNLNNACDDNEHQAIINNGLALFKAADFSNNANGAPQLVGNDSLEILAFSSGLVHKYKRRIDVSLLPESNASTVLVVNPATTIVTNCSFDSSCANSYDEAVSIVADSLGISAATLMKSTGNPELQSFLGALEVNEHTVTTAEINSHAFIDVLKDIETARDQGLTRAEIELYFKNHGSFSLIAEERIESRPDEDAVEISNIEPRCDSDVSFRVKNPVNKDGSKPMVCWRIDEPPSSPFSIDPNLDNTEANKIPDFHMQTLTNFTCSDSNTFKYHPLESGIYNVFVYLMGDDATGGLFRSSFTASYDDTCPRFWPLNAFFEKELLEASDTVSFRPYIDDPDSYVYFWDFGDGKTSFEMEPQHSYKEAGMYIVTLTMTNKLSHYSLNNSDAVTMQ